MTFPALAFLHGFGVVPHPSKQTLAGKSSRMLGWFCMALDCAAFINCIVFGILGLLSMIAMPIGAAYFLLGVSVAISAAWGVVLLTLCVDAQNKRVQTASNHS